MKIIITGATGFVGAHLTRYFAQQGHEVIALGRATKAPSQLLDFAKYQQFSLDENMPDLQADVLIHAAALASDSASYEELYAANVLGTRYLAKASAACPYFILVSSSSVYSYRDNQPRIEADAGKDFEFLTDYGKTKYLSEQELLKFENPSQKRLILRPRAIYGVGDRVILPRLLAMQRGNNFIRLGKMNVKTSQTNVKQISALIDFFINTNSINNQSIITNLADAEPYILGNSVYDLLCHLSNKKLQQREVPMYLLRMIANIGLSKKVTKFLIDAMTHDCVLDLAYLSSFYNIPNSFSLDEEKHHLANWLNQFGGIEAYLKATEDAPWRVFQ